jgi:hypothetical protein
MYIMQTFLPYPSFAASAKVLDRQRLGKQRVEVLQLLRALAGETKGWRNHPAAKMWSGYESALVEYGVAVCQEWLARGYKDTCLGKIEAFKQGRAVKPEWLGNTTFHASHRSNLLRKDAEWYGQFGWEESDDLPYVWPIQN